MAEIKISEATQKDVSKIGELAYQVAMIHYHGIKKEFMRYRAS